ncbi:unnamed protein product [Ixodes pacificus]
MVSASRPHNALSLDFSEPGCRSHLKEVEPACSSSRDIVQWVRPRLRSPCWPPFSTRRPQLQRLPIKNGREGNLIPLQFAPAYHRSLLPLAPRAFQKLLTLFPKVKVRECGACMVPFDLSIFF